jgi:hypothetical protein
LITLATTNVRAQAPASDKPVPATTTTSAAPSSARQGAQPSNPPANQQTTLPAKAVELKLTRAFCGAKPEDNQPCRLGDLITVDFENLPEWFADKNADPGKLALVIDGVVLKKTPVRAQNANSPNRLQFVLKPDENRDEWKSILAHWSSGETLRLSVGLASGPPYYGDVEFPFAASKLLTWITASLWLVLLVVFFVLAHRSDILRDPASVPDGRSCFSLARAQMAWWLFIVLASFLYIWIVTGDPSTLTTQTLVLIGISAATGLSAVVVDNDKRDKRVTLERERATIVAQVGSGTATAQQQSRLQEIDTLLKSLPGGAAWKSEGFLKDILREGDSVSFHRFQMTTWTVILGFLFIVSVVRDLSMPAFSDQLLVLMGISSGTYIGFKIPDPSK